ncbi:MAG: outer membrane beta-barrel protein, partial [Thermodesulfobacteriota bacterium]
TDLAILSGQYVDMIKNRIDELRPLHVNLNVGYEYDNNVLLKPSDQAIAGAITGQGDSRAVALFQVEYQPKTEGSVKIKMQYSLFRSEYEDIDTHNVTSHTAALVPSYKVENGVLELLLSYNYTWVDDYEYLRTFTASPGVTFLMQPGFLGQLGAMYQKKEFIRPALMLTEDRDARNYAAYIGWIKLFSKQKAFLRARYTLNRELSKGNNWSYTGHKLGASASAPLYKELRMSVAGELFYQRHDGWNTNFGVKRQDLVWTGNVGLSYELYRKLDLLFKYTYTRGDSTIALYDYEKNVTGLSINFKF